MRNQVVIDLQRRRQQREMDAIYRCIRRAVDVPDKLVDDVLGPDERHFRRDPLREQDDYDDIRMAERLSRSTGLRWPEPGRIHRVMRRLLLERRSTQCESSRKS